jgi:lysophospholipase L1-like esterase
MKRKVLAVGVIVLILTLSFATIFFVLPTLTADRSLLRVACVGDSNTQLSDYPNELQTLLGKASVVKNFGVWGSTANLNSGKPYLGQSAFQYALDFEPTTVVIMLGTNDAHPDVYESLDQFVNDYEYLISQFQALESKPKIYIVKPPPVLENDLGINGTDFVQGVLPAIEQVAQEEGLPLIDVYGLFVNQTDHLGDGVHLDGAGGRMAADLVAATLKAAPKE